MADLIAFALLAIFAGVIAGLAVYLILSAVVVG